MSPSKRERILNARLRVVQKVTEAVLATADVLEAEQRPRFWDPSGIQPWLRDRSADLHMIRAFVDTPIYEQVVRDYLDGDSDSGFLCQMVEILHELAPHVFRAPRY